MNHTGRAGPDSSACYVMATDRLAALIDEILGTIEADDRTATAPQILDVAEQLRTVWETWQR